MDSKLVVEQMSGRWKIKHPDMKPLAAEAPAGAVRHDVHLDAARAEQARRPARQRGDGRQAQRRDRAGLEALGEDAARSRQIAGPGRGAGDRGADRCAAGACRAAPTTLVLVRHGVTPHARKRFSGGWRRQPRALRRGPGPGRATADWLRRRRGGSRRSSAHRYGAAGSPRSPRRRARSGGRGGAGLREMEFGVWDGLTFAEVRERDHDGLDAWLGSRRWRPPGGESFATVAQRVSPRRPACCEAHAGRTVLVVSHVTPIKMLVGSRWAPRWSRCSGWSCARRRSGSSRTTPTRTGCPRASLRLYNARPPGNDAFSGAPRRGESQPHSLRDGRSPPSSTPHGSRARLRRLPSCMATTRAIGIS